MIVDRKATLRFREENIAIGLKRSYLAGQYRTRTVYKIEFFEA
jgi:hypothetical protein